MSGLSQCEDILLFQRTLKKLRDIDDKIIYALNLSTPTKSFQARGADTQSGCVELQSDLARSHQERGALIQKCVLLHRQSIEDAAGDKGKVRTSRNMLRLFESEVAIEDIIRERTNKVFRDKCSEHL